MSYEKKRNSSNKDRNDNRSKKRQGAYRGKSKDSEMDKTSSAGFNENTVRGRNDPKWYITDPSTAMAVANYPFGLPLGADLDWTTVTGGYDKVTLKKAVPGILAVRYIPAIGSCHDAYDPANMAAQAMYTKIRSVNSGAKNYEPADLLIYQLAMEQLYAFYAQCMRAYGILYSAPLMQRYQPRALFEASGFDYNSFIGRTADFKALLDLVAVRISQMALPSEISLFTRHQYLNLSVFKDTATHKGQLILFRPDQLWKFEGYTDRRGGKLVPYPTTTKWTYETLNAAWNELLGAVVNDIDCAIISGDILKAYEGKVMTCPIMPQTYAIDPQVDDWMLIQLHNAIAIGDVRSEVIQSEPTDAETGRYLICNIKTPEPVLKDDILIPTDQVLMDLPFDNPTPEAVIEASRLMCLANKSDYSVTDAFITVQECGSEVVTRFEIHLMEAEDFVTVRSYTSVMSSSEFEWLDALDLSTFNYHPPVTVVDATDTSALRIYVRMGEIDNCTSFTLDKLHAINNMAITAQLGIMQNASFLYR